MYQIPDDTKKLRQTNIPNIDVMAQDDLVAFYKAHQNGNNSKYLFPQGGPGTKEVTAKLAKYAISLYFTNMYREHGDHAMAKENKDSCDWIYKSLPKYAQWGS